MCFIKTFSDSQLLFGSLYARDKADHGPVLNDFKQNRISIVKTWTVAMLILMVFGPLHNVGACLIWIDYVYEVNFCEGDNCTMLSTPNTNLSEFKASCLKQRGQYIDINCTSHCTDPDQHPSNLTEYFRYGACATKDSCSGFYANFDPKRFDNSPDGYYVDSNQTIVNSACFYDTYGANRGASIVVESFPPCIYKLDSRMSTDQESVTSDDQTPEETASATSGASRSGHDIGLLTAVLLGLLSSTLISALW